MLALLSINDVTPALGSATVRHGLALGRAMADYARYWRFHGRYVWARTDAGSTKHGNRLNTILTSPPRLAFLRSVQAIRAGVILNGC